MGRSKKDDWITDWRFCKRCFNFSFFPLEKTRCASCDYEVFYNQRINILIRAQAIELRKLKNEKMKKQIKINKKIKNQNDMEKYYFGIDAKIKQVDRMKKE